MVPVLMAPREQQSIEVTKSRKLGGDGPKELPAPGACAKPRGDDRPWDMARWKGSPQLVFGMQSEPRAGPRLPCPFTMLGREGHGRLDPSHRRVHFSIPPMPSHTALGDCLVLFPKASSLLPHPPQLPRSFFSTFLNLSNICASD